MAGLIQRGNKWYASFTVIGKEQRKATGVPVIPDVIPPGKSKAAMIRENEAKARLIAEELEKAAHGERVDAEKVKAIAGERQGRKLLRGKQYMQGVKEYLNEWLSNRKDSTRRKDARAVELFISFLGEAQNMPLDMVTPDHARRFMERELERVSSGTVGLYMVNLGTAFKRAVDARVISFNPFSGIRPAKREQADKQERNAFTLEEVRRLVEILPGEWPDMVRVCLYTGGQRLGDIACLQWSQIDLKTERIFMTTEKTRRRMSKPIITPLKVVLERREKAKVNSYVFPLAALRHAQAGQSTGKLSHDFTQLLREYGVIDAVKSPRQGNRRNLSEKSFHSLRATAVTVLRCAGVPFDECRVIVGHDSEEIERVYFRPDADTISKAMKHLIL